MLLHRPVETALGFRKLGPDGPLRGEVTEMYGPPSECKGKVCGGRRSALMYPAYWWRFVLLASMRYAACLSLETPRPLEGLIGKQVSGTPF